MDVGSKEPLQVIKFDHPEPPTKHGWELIEGSEQDLLPYQRDPDHGRILQIEAEQDFCMDYRLGVLQQVCKAIAFVVRSESDFAFYAEIRVHNQQGVLPDSKRLYCHVIEGSYPEQHPDYPSEEYEVHVPVDRLKNGWVRMKIDLPEKAREAAAVRDEKWEFDRLLMLRLKVSRGEIDCARLELYKENPWERPFGLQDASDYPDRGLRQPPAIPTYPAIRQLVTLIRALHEAGERPCILLLGSSLSLTPEIRHSVCESDDWETFWALMEVCSFTERRALMVSLLAGLNLAPGYRCLAELVQVGYFDIILTANVDDALDNALRILPAHECTVLCHGQISAQEIAAALSRRAPRVKAIKLRGDINAYKLPLTPEGQFEFPKELEEAVERLLSQDTIVVGDISHDTDIQRCIRESEGALWVVVPEGPRPGSFLYNATQSRPGKVISGPEAEFVSFFSALARELGVESSEVSDAKSSAPMTFEFTFGLSDFKFSSWFPVLESLIPVLPDGIRAKEALYAEGYLDYPPDRNHVRNNKTKWLDKFLQAVVDGEATSGYIALHNLSKDGKLYDHLKVTIDTQSRELKVEITDSTRPERRQALASRILEKMGKIKSVRQVMPSPQSESISPASRRQRISQAVTVPNPFGDTGRITDPDRFFDRQQLMREVQQLLVNGCSVSLVGPSEIGKSSFLYYLYLTRNEWLPGIPVEYFDLQRVLDETDFCETILIRLGQRGRSLRDLKRALESQHVVLLFDEVERLAEPDFHPCLHDLLRSLAQEPTLAMVVATQHPLVEVFPPRGKTSPFHNVFRAKQMGTFTPTEARAFLQHRLKGTGVIFTSEETDDLVVRTGGHPAQLQIAAYQLFDTKLR